MPISTSRREFPLFSPIIEPIKRPTIILCRHNQGCTTNGQCGRDNVNLQESKTNTHSHGIQLVAIAVVTSNQKPCRRRGSSSSSSAPRKPSIIIRPPRNISSTNAIQWFHSRTNRLANMPIPQPISGVRVSTAPKIRPVRNASENFGLWRWHLYRLMQQRHPSTYQTQEEQ